MAYSAAVTIEWPATPAWAGGQFADVPATRSDFSACVDRCVRALLATARPIRPADGAFAQLQRWLHDDGLTLADGTPVDFALFDETILSVNERIASTSTGTLAQLLRAARRLAESIYTKS